jgi:hypothetical protein
MTILKDDFSLEESSIESLSNITNNDAPKDLKTQKLVVERLQPLDIKLADSILERRGYYEQLCNSLDVSEETIKVGMYKGSDGRFIAVLPNAIFTEDNLIGAMMTDLCKTTETEIRVTPKDALVLKTDEHEDYIMGFWFGFYSESIHKRSRAKKEHELGRTQSHSLCVKAFFNNTSYLGSAALEKDHFYFGNNPGEKTMKNDSINYDLPSRWSSLLTRDSEADGLLTIFNHIANVIQMNYLPNDNLKSLIDYNVEKFDTIAMKNFQISYSSKKKKNVKTEVKRPNFPKRSPLFLNDEMALLEKLLRPFWTPLTEFKNDYVNWIITMGYNEVINAVTTIYKRRWQILSKFAKVTTKRLQEVRKTGPEAAAYRKSVVDSAHIQKMLEARRLKIETFYSEISSIIPDADLRGSVSGLHKGKPASDEDARNLILAEIGAVYLKPGIDLITTQKDVNITFSNIDIDEIVSAEKAVNDIVSNSTGFTLRGPSKFKNLEMLHRKYVALLLHLRNIKETQKVLESFTPKAIEYALKAANVPLTNVSQLTKSIEKHWNLQKDYHYNIMRTLSFRHETESLAVATSNEFKEITNLLAEIRNFQI